MLPQCSDFFNCLQISCMKLIRAINSPLIKSSFQPFSFFFCSKKTNKSHLASIELGAPLLARVWCFVFFSRAFFAVLGFHISLILFDQTPSLLYRYVHSKVPECISHNIDFFLPNIRRAISYAIIPSLLGLVWLSISSSLCEGWIHGHRARY